MMDAAVSTMLRREFAFAAANREEDILYREKMARFEAGQRIKLENERIGAEKRDRDTFDLLYTAFASERQITAFHAKLDRYDEKTVEALQENRVALDEVQKRLDDMLGKAHVLPDGRRVFKTDDGTRVYDETGLELSADTIDPNAIADSRPRWERYKSDFDENDRLLKEQDNLHAFQAKSDAAREELGRGGVTADRLDELDADMKATMPEAVRRKLGNEGSGREAGLTAEGVQPEAAVTGLQNSDRRPAAFAPM